MKRGFFRNGRGKEKEDQSGKPNLNRDQAVVILLGAAVLAYAFFRAAVLSLTHDEALTYMLHAYGGFGDIFHYTKIHAANNHLLNTLLIKIITDACGGSELLIRLPALAGFGLYLFGVYRLLKLFLPDERLPAGFAFMVSNPFLLDFFSCARGYSLGLGFSLLAWYFLFRRIAAGTHREAVKHDTLSLALAALAALANGSFLNVFPAVFCLLIFLEAKENLFSPGGRRPETFRKMSLRLLPATVGSGICLALVYHPAVLKVITADAAVSGGRSGFWKDTVGSLVKCTFYGKPYWIKGMAGTEILIVLTLVAAVGVPVCLYLRKNFPMPSRYLLATMFLLLATAGAVKAGFVFFRINYVRDRSALYFLPLHGLLVLLLWQHLFLIRPGPVARFGNGGFRALILLACLHGILCLNRTHFYIWKYDAGTRTAVKMIDAAIRKRPESAGKYRLGVNWIFIPSVNYYLYRNRMDKRVQWVVREDTGADGVFDYYYLRPDEGWIIEKRNLKVIEYFPLSHTWLAAPPEN